jgi:hypothetical protein
MNIEHDILNDPLLHLERAKAQLEMQKGERAIYRFKESNGNLCLAGCFAVAATKNQDRTASENEIADAAAYVMECPAATAFRAAYAGRMDDSSLCAINNTEDVSNKSLLFVFDKAIKAEKAKSKQ